MGSELKSAVEIFIEQEQLPASYMETVEQWFLPMAETILQKAAHQNGTLVIGISGCQGSGKSTLASLLVILLNKLLGLKSVNLSIDDFYLTHSERQTLGQTIHPLLATRGVPGTHDVQLAIDTIDALKKPGEVAIPRFNKAIDDRAPEEEWPIVQGPVDVIILEGWCIAIDAEDEESLANPVNSLEEMEDELGLWRSYVNSCNSCEYGPLYEMIDYLIMLKAPSFEKVFEWRQNQETKLIEKVAAGASSRTMDEAELKRFIQHYERITRHGLNTLPSKADIVFQLSDQQTILGVA